MDTEKEGLVNKTLRVLGIVLLIGLAAPLLAADRQITRTLDLSPGALVKVGGFNGRVEIETGPGSQTVIEITRHAKSEADLEARPVFIESSGNVLRVGVDSSGYSRASVKDEVYLRIPETVAELSVQGINGKVTCGYIDGSATVEGVNGPVTLAQGGGTLQLEGINGAIEVEMGTPQDVQMEGINGSITLRVPEGSSFDFEAESKNGRVEIDLPNVYIEEDERSHFRARVGNGGPRVTLEGVNGRITIKP